MVIVCHEKSTHVLGLLNVQFIHSTQFSCLRFVGCISHGNDIGPMTYIIKGWSDKIAYVRNPEMCRSVLIWHQFIFVLQCTSWRHQMESFSALLALYAGNSPVTGEFPAQRPVTWRFDAFFDLCLNKRLSKQSWGWWFDTPSFPLWRRCNANGKNICYLHYICTRSCSALFSCGYIIIEENFGENIMNYYSQVWSNTVPLFPVIYIMSRG